MDLPPTSQLIPVDHFHGTHIAITNGTIDRQLTTLRLG